MNFQGKAILVYLEEDNVARAYFRVQPLMTQDGPLGPMAGEYPDEGFLRIVPDKNEQHTFKERMRTLSGLCLVDLRYFPSDANKIRTNKNYSPSRGETNQYIVYSDAVRPLPDDLLYQVVSEANIKSAVTPYVYVRNGANIQGPFRRDNGEAKEKAVQLPPDSSEIHTVNVNGQELLIYWPRAVEAPEAAEPAQVQEQPVSQPPVQETAPVSPAPALEPPAETAPQQNAYEQIQSLNEQLSENANRLNDTAPSLSMDFVQDQPARPLTGTKLYQTPQRQVNPRRAHNALMEAVENQRYASRFETSRYEAPGATIPQNTELKEVHNPIEVLKRAIQGMSHSPEDLRQAADVILSQSGMRIMLSKALAQETNDLTLAAMHTQLQELEAERLMTLMQLDDAKKNLSEAHEAALGKLNMAEQKKLDQLHIAQQTAQNALNDLNKAIAPLEKKRQDALLALENMKNAQDQRLISAACGQNVSREELISRVETALKTAGFIMEEGDALCLLTALALTKENFEICSDTQADAQVALAALALALGAPLVESDWDEKLVVMPGGNSPVLVEYNGVRHPLVWQVSIDSVSDRESGDTWHFPYASVPIQVNGEALPGCVEKYAPVTKECVMQAFIKDIDLSDEAKAVVASLRKNLKAAGAPLPVAAVDMICRFVSATQNELNGGVAEAIDRASCLYIIPHLFEYAVELDAVKELFAAMPRTLKALKV